MIVLDANILIRAVLGRRVRQLIDTYAGQGVRFFAPDVAFDDAEKYLPPLLKKRGKFDADLSASLEYLRNIIEVVTPELYAVFESSGCAVETKVIGRYSPQHSDWQRATQKIGSFLTHLASLIAIRYEHVTCHTEELQRRDSA